MKFQALLAPLIVPRGVEQIVFRNVDQSVCEQRCSLQEESVHGFCMVAFDRIRRFLSFFT